MGDRYLNLGAPFTTLDGQRVGRREVFEPTDERDVLQRKYKLRKVVESGRNKHESDSATSEPETTDEEDTLDDYAVGGGWYLIDGEKVQGRVAAREALQALED